METVKPMMKPKIFEDFGPIQVNTAGKGPQSGLYAPETENLDLKEYLRTAARAIKSRNSAQNRPKSTHMTPF